MVGCQFANLGPHPRHRPKTDNLPAFHAGSQLYAASEEVACDPLATGWSKLSEIMVD